MRNQKLSIIADEIVHAGMNYEGPALPYNVDAAIYRLTVNGEQIQAPLSITRLEMLMNTDDQLRTLVRARLEVRKAGFERTKDA